jgi:LuxR family maltose regulon positive regulatory protein
LVERLNAGLPANKLILVSAPAGFGKTTLLSEWIGSRVRSTEYGVGKEHELADEVSPTHYSPRSVPTPSFAWLSLDQGDNDPARFIVYLVAALQTAEERIGRQLPVAQGSPQPPAIEACVGALINEISALPHRFVLVLDDYHTIKSRAIHDAVAFLLDHLPGNMHLVITTRADPPLPLARLRGRGQLAELRQADLRFTADEVMAFLNLSPRLPTAPRAGSLACRWLPSRCKGDDRPDRQMAYLPLFENSPAAIVLSSTT